MRPRPGHPPGRDHPPRAAPRGFKVYNCRYFHFLVGHRPGRALPYPPGRSNYSRRLTVATLSPSGPQLVQCIVNCFAQRVKLSSLLAPQLLKVYKCRHFEFLTCSKCAAVVSFSASTVASEQLCSIQKMHKAGSSPPRPSPSSGATLIPPVRLSFIAGSIIRLPHPPSQIVQRSRM